MGGAGVGKQQRGGATATASGAGTQNPCTNYLSPTNLAFIKLHFSTKKSFVLRTDASLYSTTMCPGMYYLRVRLFRYTLRIGVWRCLDGDSSLPVLQYLMVCLGDLSWSDFIGIAVVINFIVYR